MKVVLHAGLHKTGSTWLQQDIFASWNEINYLGDFSISDYARSFKCENLDDRPALFSSEAACGYPIPENNGFDPKVLSNIVTLLNVTHIIIIIRSFEEWCFSLYFQTLNEGYSWSFEGWLEANSRLKEWRHVESRLRVEFEKSSVRLLFLYYEDIQNNTKKELDKISKFLSLKFERWQN